MQASRSAILAVPPIFAALLAGCLVAPTGPSAPLAERVRLYSEDVLNPLPPGIDPEAVSGFDCPLPDAEVEAFDAMLELAAADIDDARARHAPWGFTGTDVLLTHGEYLVNYDPELKLPTFASYRLEADDVISRTRENCFREDPRLDPAGRSILDDYVEPVFDRGHLVPRADMNRSRAAMINTFVLSNMMPQHDNFNQGIWRTFEGAVRSWAVDKGTIVVVTGPLFDFDDDLAPDDPGTLDRVRPLENVAIPSHFFKIVLHERPNGFIEALAVVLPHTDGDVPMGLTVEEELAIIALKITSIDDIEAASGFDFFPDMPAAKQFAVERSIAPGLWE